jgi:hypothetical protein
MSMYMTNFNIVYYVQYCAFYVLGKSVLIIKFGGIVPDEDNWCC